MKKKLVSKIDELGKTSLYLYSGYYCVKVYYPEEVETAIADFHRLKPRTTTIMLEYPKPRVNKWYKFWK